VAAYQEVERAFSEGDRVQSKDLHVAYRELGTIENINHAGDLQIRMDPGRESSIHLREHPHLDHRYLATGNRSQGRTAQRVLIHVDPDESKLLVNNRFTCVSVSRPQHGRGYLHK